MSLVVTNFPDLSHFLSICDFSISVSGPNVKNMKVRKWCIGAGSDKSDRYLAWLWWRVSDNHKGVRDGTKGVQELLILPLQCLRLNFIRYFMNNIFIINRFLCLLLKESTNDSDNYFKSSSTSTASQYMQHMQSAAAYGGIQSHGEYKLPLFKNCKLGSESVFLPIFCGLK